MPTVPSLGPTPSVAPNELQAPQVNRLLMMATGAGGQELENMGQGIMRSSGQIGQIANEQQATQNEIDAKNADNQYLQAQTQLLHDPDKGYLNTQGQNATGPVRDAALSAIQELPDKIANDIQNPRARQMFLQTAQARATAAMQAIDIHASQQGNQAAIEASVGRSDAAAQAMPTAYDPLGQNNELYNQYQSTLVQELNEQADRKGLPADARAQFIQAGLGKAYAATISHLMATNQTGAAKEYLASVRDQLPDSVADKAQELLQAGSDKDTGLAASIGVQKDHPGNINAQEAALKDQFTAGKITATQYDIALSHAHADYQLQKSQEADTDRNFLGNIWAQHVQNPGMSLASLSAQQLQYARSRNLGPQIEQMLAHNDSTDNPALFLKLMRQAQDDPASFVNQDVTQFQGQLSATNFRMLESTYLNINKQDVAAQQVDKLQADTVKGAMAQLKAAGLDPKAKEGTSAADEYAKFETQLHQTLFLENQARQVKGQAPLSPNEARERALDLVKTQALAGTGLWGTFQTSGPTYALVDKVPDTDRQQITEALKARGQPVTPANIVRLYNARHAKTQ